MTGHFVLSGTLLAFLLASAARAGDDSARIEGGKVSGVGAVNVAAGSGNQQNNAGVISIGDFSESLTTVSQSTGDAPDSHGKLAATIAPNSFVGSTGWLAINGIAGSGNQQANLAIFALGTTGAALSDTALSQARASHEPTAGPDTAASANDRSVAIGAGAFANSNGLVQVSLIGGDRNSSANVFALSSSVGANH